MLQNCSQVNHHFSSFLEKVILEAAKKLFLSMCITKRRVFLHKMPQMGTADVDLCPRQLIFFSITLSTISLLIQQVLSPWHLMSDWMFLHIWWKLDSVFLPNLVLSGVWWSLWIIDSDGKVTNAQLCCRAWAFFLGLIITLSPLCLLVIMSTGISCCLHHKRGTVHCSAAAARILFPVVVWPELCRFFNCKL